MRKQKTIRVRMDEYDMKLLEDLDKMFGYNNYSRTVRDSILIVHILLKLGIHRILKPLPQLAELLISEEAKHEETENTIQRFK